MKKIIKIIFILVITIIIIPVKAANYNMKELIPVNTSTTIVTNNFSYRNFFYNDNKLEADTLKNNFIIFENIKNLTDKELPVSISVGLFDKDKKNIGTVNYCSTQDKTSVVAGTKLKSKEEKNYVIEVNKKHLAPEKSVNDIKYIAVLSDNINCRVAGSQDFVGQKVEEIKVTKNSILEYSSTKLFIKIFSIVAVFLVVLFLYKFLFTNSFRNFDGEDIRKEFVYKNKQLAKERKYSNQVVETPPKAETKSNKIKNQELEENQKQNKEGTDLHNLYK